MKMCVGTHWNNPMNTHKTFSWRNKKKCSSNLQLHRASDKRGYRDIIFLISQREHVVGTH